MDEAVQTKQYLIGGVTYRLEPQSWRQVKWLVEHIFGDRSVMALDYATIHNLLREKGPLFMAICLLRAGETRAQQAALPWHEIQARAELFAGELTGGEVAMFGPHFFQSCRPDQMVLLNRGEDMQRMMEKMREEMASESQSAPGATGSSGVSSSSAEGMSPKSEAFSPSGDRLIPIPTLSGASNGSA